MTGFVYFIQSVDRIKIGYSTSPGSRLVKISADSPYDCTLLGYVPADMFSEREIHQHFAEFRRRGEWFAADPKIIAFVKAYSVYAPVQRADTAPSNYSEAQWQSIEHHASILGATDEQRRKWRERGAVSSAWHARLIQQDLLLIDAFVTETIA